jgi:hypothetical protein
VLVIITLGLLVVRVILALAVTRPTIMMDERCYLTMAKALASGQLPYSREYGPLYPALLSPALRLPSSHSYLLARLTGCVLSVVVVPLLFVMLRNDCSDGAALCGAAVAGMLPSHVLSAPLLMSENVFYPLILLASLVTLRVARDGRHYIPMVLLSAALVLTKKLGWAVVAGGSLFLLISSRDSRPWARWGACILPWLGAVAASICWHVAGQNCEPLCQGLTPTGAIPATTTFRLTQDSFLHHLVGLTADPVVLGAVAWIRWMLAHGAYVAVVCLWLPVLARPWRRRPPSIALLGLCVMLALMALSSHHNLEGWQRDQYIRGRYMDGALPLLLVPSLVILLRRNEAPHTGALAAGLVLALLFRPEDAAHGQNRNLAWLSPFLQGAVVSSDGGIWAAKVMVAVTWVGFWSVLKRLGDRRRFLIAMLVLFLIAANGAALVRLARQQVWAREYSKIALWLRDHGPRVPVIAVQRGASPEADKKSGLIWVLEQILFWTDARLVRETKDAPFLLSAERHPLPELSSARYGDISRYYLYDRRVSPD